jgi:uncharacterized membrane protein
MSFPFTFWDVSLWLAVTAIILLATAEIISPYYGRTNLIIEKKKLKRVSLVLGILFLITVVIRVYEIVISP